jgi:hypothetical protein
LEVSHGCLDIQDALAKAAAAIAPEFSEDQLALDFTARHREDLRYVAQWGKWLR